MLNKLQRKICNEELIIIEMYEKFIRNTMALSKRMDQLCKNEEDKQKRYTLRQNKDNLDIAIVKSFSELAKNLHHFNFANEIVKFVLNFSLNKNKVIQEIVQELYVHILASQNPSFCKHPPLNYKF